MSETLKCRREACIKHFKRTSQRRYFCSRECANAHHTLYPMGRKRYHPQAAKAIPAHMGPAIIPPQVPPLCHGQALAFGSDPHTGTSIQYCAICGEKPLQRFGKIRYPQRPDFEAELEERFEAVKQKPKATQGKAKTWQNNFQIVSHAMRNKLDGGN